MNAMEQQLLTIRTQQAYAAYLKGDFSQAAQAAQQIEELNKGDIHARFLRGAITGRQARPGKEMYKIQAAIRIWRPLYEQLTADALETMKAAIAETLSTILYIPAELSSRGWDVYHDVRTAAELKETVRALLSFDDGYAAQTGSGYDQWIHTLFTGNYVFLVDEIIGMNKPYPVGADTPNVIAYGRALEAIADMAERIPDDTESGVLVKQRAMERLEHFRLQNKTRAGSSSVQ